MKHKVKIGLLGASGKMGIVLRHLIETEFKNKAQLEAQVSQQESKDSLFGCDAIIDFSSPEAFLEFKKASEKTSLLPPIILGTTGWNKESWTNVETLATRTCVLFSANFSIGVFLTREILKFASPKLAAAGYTPVLVEGHHIHKKDAPSGTAKSLCEAINPNNPESVQTHSVRAGEVIGDHEVSFYSASDKIVVGHFAQDRSIFARGAIEAALWLASKTGARPGLVSMESFVTERFLKT